MHVSITRCLKVFKLKLVCKYVIDNIVVVFSVDETISLVAIVHGSPTKLVIFLLSLHEAPDRTTHYRYRLLVRYDQDLTDLINFNSPTEKLPYRIEKLHYMM